MEDVPTVVSMYIGSWSIESTAMREFRIRNCQQNRQNHGIISPRNYLCVLVYFIALQTMQLTFTNILVLHLSELKYTPPYRLHFVVKYAFFFVN